MDFIKSFKLAVSQVKVLLEKFHDLSFCFFFVALRSHFLLIYTLLRARTTKAAAPKKKVDTSF